LDTDRRVLDPRHPSTLDSLEWLGIDLSHLGRFGEAERFYREAIQVAMENKEPSTVDMAWYNFACGAAVAGRTDQAIEYLSKAGNGGVGSASGWESDDDLKSLHGDPRFEALLAKARQPAPAIAK
jgi:hypothetical protein